MRNNMFKKTLCGLLGASLLFSGSSTAFAATVEEEARNVLTPGTYNYEGQTTSYTGGLSMGDGVDLTATGSNSDPALHIDGEFLQEGGNLTLNGHDGYGMQFGYEEGNKFIQTGGSLTANGSNGYSALNMSNGAFSLIGGTIDANAVGYGDGIFAGMGFTQEGGTINAKAVSYGGSGLHVAYYGLNQNGGEINAYGDEGGHGLHVDFFGMTQNNGTIKAVGDNGGSGVYVYSMGLTQNGGEITATGLNGGSGFYAQNNGFIQNNGTIFAKGDGEGSSGLYSYEGGIQQTNGLIEVSGLNGGVGAFIYGGAINQDRGVIKANAANENSYGIYSEFSDFTKVAGDFEAAGDNGGYGYYNTFGDFVQNGGRTIARGTKGGYGIYQGQGDMYLNYGTLTASGQNGGYGIYFRDGAFKQDGGTLKLEAGDGYALYVENPENYLIFKSGDVISEFDLANDNAGSIYVGNGDRLQVHNGVNFTPELKNSDIMNVGDTKTIAFLESGKNELAGRFIFQPVNSLTFDYSLVNIDEKTQGLTITRKALPSEILPDDGTDVLENIEDNLNNGGNTGGDNGNTGGDNGNTGGDSSNTGGDNGNTGGDNGNTGGDNGNTGGNSGNTGGSSNQDLSDALSEIDSSQTLDEMREKVNGLTPHSATVYANGARYNTELARNAFSDRINAIQSCDWQSAPSGGMQSNYEWTGWVQGIGYSSRQRTTENGGATKEHGGGFSLGVGRNIENGTVGIAGHYLRGKISGSGFNADSDTYGVTVGGRIRPFKSCSLSPWLDASVSYSKTAYQQIRRDVLGSFHNADIDVDTFAANLMIGNDFQVTERLRLTPSVGFDFAHTIQSDYVESSKNGLGLRVGGSNGNSLRAKAGVEAEYALKDNLSIKGHAIYNHELLDPRTELRASFTDTPDIRFNTKGAKVGRSSGNVGAGLSYNINERTTLNFDYDLAVADKFTGHTASAMLKFEF